MKKAYENEQQRHNNPGSNRNNPGSNRNRVRDQNRAPPGGAHVPAGPVDSNAHTPPRADKAGGASAVVTAAPAVSAKKIDPLDPVVAEGSSTPKLSPVKDLKALKQVELLSLLEQTSTESGAQVDSDSDSESEEEEVKPQVKPMKKKTITIDDDNDSETKTPARPSKKADSDSDEEEVPKKETAVSLDKERERVMAELDKSMKDPFLDAETRARARRVYRLHRIMQTFDILNKERYTDKTPSKPFSASSVVDNRARAPERVCVEVNAPPTYSHSAFEESDGESEEDDSPKKTPKKKAAAGSAAGSDTESQRSSLVTTTPGRNSVVDFSGVHNAPMTRAIVAAFRNAEDSVSSRNDKILCVMKAYETIMNELGVDRKRYHSGFMAEIEVACIEGMTVNPVLQGHDLEDAHGVKTEVKNSAGSGGETNFVFDFIKEKKGETSRAYYNRLLEVMLAKGVKTLCRYPFKSTTRQYKLDTRFLCFYIEARDCRGLERSKRSENLNLGRTICRRDGKIHFFERMLKWQEEWLEENTNESHEARLARWKPRFDKKIPTQC